MTTPTPKRLFLDDTFGLQRGDEVTYQKAIAFKGPHCWVTFNSLETTATVVTITGRKILLDNGDEFWKI